MRRVVQIVHVAGNDAGNKTKKQTVKTYNVRSCTVRALKADLPVKQVTVIPAILGFPGWSDEVTVQPGERLEIVRNGSAESWSEAVIVPAGVQIAVWHEETGWYLFKTWVSEDGYRWICPKTGLPASGPEFELASITLVGGPRDGLTVG